MKNLLLIIAASTILISCGPSKAEIEAIEKEMQVSNVGEGNDTPKEEPKKIEEQVINSVEFIKNSLADNFFLKDNANKDFVITDLLVSDYSLSNDGNEAVITAYPYDPVIKKYLHFVYKWPNGEEIKDPHFIFNGEKLGCIKESTKRDKYSITLRDPKQLKLLKMYNSIKSYDHAHGDGNGIVIEDLIKIRGTFTKFDFHLLGFGEYVYFTNAEIINEDED
ncbi:MAG TPA: hypothetical protein VF411_06120 [Bacteroidia bacterium]